MGADLFDVHNAALPPEVRKDSAFPTTEYQIIIMMLCFNERREAEPRARFQRKPER